ncbi:phosphoglycerate mutase-like protein [Apiospora kogelbergensis]|uniref:Phosphoglycerate mutase-like protein n=1 Tax=Apiospora kogelbergensis TaxID=1337665 RepID=A0AAW0R3X6_9PEZI
MSSSQSSSLGLLLKALPLASLASAATLNSNYKFNPLEHLGGVAPYFESKDPVASPDVPQGCTASRAAYLVRHAAIAANDFDYETYLEPFVSKVENKTNIDWSKIPTLNFLADWSAPVGEEDEEMLTRVGRLEATRLGVDLFFRYSHLKLPKKVYTSSAERTHKSAQSLVRGFEFDDNTMNVVDIYEGKKSGADSLTPYKACPKYSSSAGSDESSVMKKKYTKPIMARLNDLAPEFNFTTNDVYGMMEMCGYESVIRGKSPFCDLDLFTPDDWLAWEYTEDVRYHYNVGYGNEVAGAVGLPWLNATASLLMNNDKEAEDLYVSFTHRELPPMVLVAMGLFNNSQFGGVAESINDTMPLDRINYRRAWKASSILPFLTNLAVERLNCTGSYGYEDGEYYRVLVNSAPQPLDQCADGPGTTCSRAGFESYLQERVNMFSGDKGFTAACGVEYKNSTDTLSIYTDSGVGNGTIVGKRHEKSYHF